AVPIWKWQLPAAGLHPLGAVRPADATCDRNCRPASETPGEPMTYVLTGGSDVAAASASATMSAVVLHSMFDSGIVSWGNPGTVCAGVCTFGSPSVTRSTKRSPGVVSAFITP